MKEIILDTETTGLSVKDGHRLVEIGCIELENLIPTENKFHCYLNPERKVSEKALEVHGYTDEFLFSKKKFDARDIHTQAKNHEIAMERRCHSGSARARFRCACVCFLFFGACLRI